MRVEAWQGVARDLQCGRAISCVSTHTCGIAQVRTDDWRLAAKRNCQNWQARESGQTQHVVYINLDELRIRIPQARLMLVADCSNTVSRLASSHAFTIV